MKPRVHILPLSKLVHASPAGWEKLLRDVEDGKVRAFKYYLPLREAAIKLCRKKGNERDRILAQMITRARSSGGRLGDRIASDNEKAFRVFEEVFFPRIRRFKRDFLRDGHPGVTFADAVTIFGHPHLEVIDDSGQERLVVLHAAEWKPDELRAYLDLLSVIVEKRFGRDASSIWCMNLRRGTEERVSTSRRLRTKCENAAKLYGRLISAMTSED